MAPSTPVVADPDTPPVTRILARFVATHPSRSWSEAVDHEAHRTFLNWAGCAVGASGHEAASAALAGLAMLEPAPQACILGRRERLDMAGAALVNGISSHVLDFDDTHLRTIIHPAGPVASALLALAEGTGASGRALIDALVLGIDVSCRLGNVMYPEHYERGWHITGSTGTLGAAAGCARLLGLDEERTAMALGIAATQPVGMREQFGTMTKAFHPGGAARAGLTAALLARHGFTASPRAIEAPLGYARVVSTKCDWREAVDALGSRFEISTNAYKPYACGVVIHPAIDAATQLRERGVNPADVERVELRVNPLALALTGKQEPRDGMEGKYSIYHGFAAGLTFGRAGEEEFSDAIVTRPDMIELRRKVVATVDTAVREESADVTAILEDGRREHVFVEAALGSVQRPMTDAALEAKFTALALPVLGAPKTAALIAACWGVGAAPDVSALVAAGRP